MTLITRRLALAGTLLACSWTPVAQGQSENPDMDVFWTLSETVVMAEACLLHHDPVFEAIADEAFLNLEHFMLERGNEDATTPELIAGMREDLRILATSVPDSPALADYCNGLLRAGG